MKKYKSFIPTLGAALLLSLGSAFCAQAADIGCGHGGRHLAL